MLDLVDVIKKSLKYRAESLEPESIEYYFIELERSLTQAIIQAREIRILVNEHYSSSKPTSE